MDGLFLGGLEAGLGVADAEGYLLAARRVVGLLGVEVTYPGHFWQVVAVLIYFILVVGVYFLVIHAESRHK